MNLTMVDYNGNVLQEGIQQLYNKYYSISDDKKKSYSERYSDFIENLKVMKYSYVGDKFYNK